MSGQPVDTLRYAIDGDLAPFKAKAAQVDAEAARLGGAIKDKTKNAFDGVTAGADRAAAATAKAAAAAEAAQARVAAAAEAAANRMQVALTKAAATSEAAAARKVAAETAASAKVAAAAEAAAARRASADAAIRAAEIRAAAQAEATAARVIAAEKRKAAAAEAAATRRRVAEEKVAASAVRTASGAIPLKPYQAVNLGQQAQDLVVSLGSGQSPLIVMLQQLPQAASAAGGFGNSLKLMGGAAGIARIAVGGLAVGVGATLVTAFVKGQGEAAALERRLALIGGAAGVTRGQIEMMSRSVEGVGRGQAREIMGGLAAGGNTPSGSLVQATQLTRDYARATGSSNEDATKFWNEILDKPAEGARKLAEDFNALSAEQVRLIDDLAASGQAEQAREVIIRRSGEGFSAAAEQVGYLEQAAQKGGDALSGLWDRIKGIGRPETPEQELERARGRLAEYAPGGLNAMFGMGSAAAQGWQGRVSALEAQVNAEQATARNRERRAADNQLLLGATGSLGPWAVEQTRERQRRESISNAQAILAAAQRQGDQSAVRLAQEALRNAQNPNYVAGSGVPKGRRSPAARIDTGARDAELARMEVENARALGSTPLRDREALRARQQAEAEFVRNSADPRRRGNAASIRDSRNEAFGISQTTRQRDVVTAVQEETTAQNRLAEAYGRGTAAAAAQVQQGQAHTAWLQGQIADEDEYARALSVRATAQAQASEAQARQQRTLGNQALGRLAAAGGNPAAMEAARIENEALAQTQTLRDTAAAELLLARSDEELAAARERLAAAEQALAVARAQGGEAAALNRQIAANDNDSRVQDSIQLREAEVRLTYASTEARIREIVAIQAYQQAVSEGLKVGSDEFNQRVSNLRTMNEELALLDATLSGQTNNAKLVDNLRSGLEDIGMAATRGFDSARDAASSFFRQLGDLIVQLYIIQPLLNALMGTEKGSVGGFLGSIGKSAKGGGGGGGFWSSVANAVGSFFGGGRAGGGPLDPGKFYLVGEQGPEILGPGVGGNVIPIRPPNSQGVQSSTPSAPQAMTMAFTIDISGANGDAAVAAIARQATAEGVTAALTAYDASLNRSIGAKIQMANRRRIA